MINFNIEVPDLIIEYCRRQVQLYNFGKRSSANGTKEQQLTGLIGESIVRTLFEKSLPDGSKGFDGGYDLVIYGKRFDVKTMGRKTDFKSYYVNNFISSQAEYECDAYIFCSLNIINGILTVIGWISKEEFSRFRKFYPKGTLRVRSDGSMFETFADMYEIDSYDLMRSSNLNELKKSIFEYYKNKK